MASRTNGNKILSQNHERKYPVQQETSADKIDIDPNKVPQALLKKRTKSKSFY